jgi:hypothetical protein
MNKYKGGNNNITYKADVGVAIPSSATSERAVSENFSAPLSSTISAKHTKGWPPPSVIIRVAGFFFIHAFLNHLKHDYIVVVEEEKL